MACGSRHSALWAQAMRPGEARPHPLSVLCVLCGCSNSLCGESLSCLRVLRVLTPYGSRVKLCTIASSAASAPWSLETDSVVMVYS